MSDEISASSSSVSDEDDCDLCNQVIKKLGHDDISGCLSLQNELIEMDGKFNESIIRYFTYKIIMTNVLKFLDNKKVTQSADILQPTSSLKGDNVCVDIDSLYMNIVRKYITSESEGDIKNPFGISKDFYSKVVCVKRKHLSLEAENNDFNEFLEKIIMDFCIKLAKHTGYAQKYKNNWKKSFKESVEDLSSQAELMDIIYQEMSSNKATVNDYLATYYKGLLEGVNMLKKLFIMNEKKVDFAIPLNEMFSTKCSALSLRLEKFELEVLTATYKPKDIEALEIISNIMDCDDSKLKELAIEVNATLQPYTVLGSEFKSIVEEYTNICKDIRNHEWAIEAVTSKLPCGESTSEDVPEA